MINNYKIINPIFIKYNCLLPYSLHVERMFSILTNINCDNRNIIGDIKFEYIVVLRCNMH